MAATPEAVKQKIFHLRDKQRKTLQEIADEVNVSVPTVSRILNTPELKSRYSITIEEAEEYKAKAELMRVGTTVTKEQYEVVLNNVGGAEALDILLKDFIHQAYVGRVTIVGTKPNWEMLDETGLGDATKSYDVIDVEHMFD